MRNGLEKVITYNLLLLLAASGQELKGHERADGNVFVVHEVPFVKGQSLHKGASFGNVSRIEKKHHAFAITAREPLRDLAVEVQLDGRFDLRGHYFHYLLARD